MSIKTKCDFDGPQYLALSRDAWYKIENGQHTAIL